MSIPELREHLLTHRKMPTNTTNRPLTNWVLSQRELHTEDSLTPETERELESIPLWLWKPKNAPLPRPEWVRNYMQLLEYSRRNNGTIPAPLDDSFLNAWVIRMHVMHRNHALSDAKMSLLEAVPGWQWRENLPSWNRSFLMLKQFMRDNYGRTPSMMEDPRLSQWVTNQRATYHRGELDDERIRQLESLDKWTWTSDRSVTPKVTWVRRCKRITRRMQRGKPLNVRDGNWVKLHRSKYYNGQLSAEKQEILENCPGWSWGTPPWKQLDGWEKRAQNIEDFVSRTGHWPRHTDSDHEERSLYQWWAQTSGNHERGRKARAGHPEKFEKLCQLKKSVEYEEDPIT